MKKLLLVMLLVGSYLFGAMNVQTASKAELMSISGIGEKKADAIIKYRKKHRLKSADDLLKVPGIGKNIVKNVKKGVKNKAQSSANSKKKSSQKKKNSQKKEMKKKKSQKKKKKSSEKKNKKKKK